MLRTATHCHEEEVPIWNVTPPPPGTHVSTREREGTSQTYQAAMKTWGDTFRLCLIRISNPGTLTIISFISMRR